MADKKENKLSSFLKKIKTEYLILIALAIVAVIIFMGTFSSGEAQSTQETVSTYVDNLERKLESCLSKVKGAGKVEVIISVSSGMQTVFATEKTYQSSKGETVEGPIIVNGKPIVTMEAYPEISGVVIVAEGAGNLSVKVDLLNACQTFLSISNEKIQILSMK